MKAALLAISLGAAALACGDGGVRVPAGSPTDVAATASPPVPKERNSPGFAASDVFPGIDPESPCAGPGGYLAPACPISSRLRDAIRGWEGAGDPICRCRDTSRLPGVGPVTEVSTDITYVEILGDYNVTLVALREGGRWIIGDAFCTGNSPQSTGLLAGKSTGCAAEDPSQTRNSERRVTGSRLGAIG